MSASVNPVFSIQFGCGGILGTFEALLNGFLDNQSPQKNKQNWQEIEVYLI